MKIDNRTICIIDDDQEICVALRYLFESVHYRVETYKSAYLFLDNYHANKRSCFIIDVRMPGMSGLELLEHLKLQKNRTPTIMISGYGDILMAIRALKCGAYDFVLKPFSEQCLLENVEKIIVKTEEKLTVELINERFNRLSARESQIIALIAEGKLNKEIAYELSISMSTVEVHRANIMKKMQAKNLAQLIKLYLKVQHDFECS